MCWDGERKFIPLESRPTLCEKKKENWRTRVAPSFGCFARSLSFSFFLTGQFHTNAELNNSCQHLDWPEKKEKRKCVMRVAPRPTGHKARPVTHFLTLACAGILNVILGQH